MPGTVFVRGGNNNAIKTTGTFPRLINGDTVNYPGASPLTEDVQYPMRNVLNGSRYNGWWSGPTAGFVTVNVEIDLGTNRTVKWVAVHGVRYAPGEVFPSTINVNFKTSGAGWASAWGSGGFLTVSAAARDGGVTIASPFTGRYVQLAIQNVPAAGFGFGMVSLGTYVHGSDFDPGFLYSPMMVRQTISPMIHTRGAGGVVSMRDLGDKYDLVEMSFRNIPDATRSALDSVFKNQQFSRPVMWVDHNGVFRQVVLSNDRYVVTHVFGAPHLWNVDLELETLS